MDWNSVNIFADTSTQFELQSFDSQHCLEGRRATTLRWPSTTRLEHLVNRTFLWRISTWTQRSSGPTLETATPDQSPKMTSETNTASWWSVAVGDQFDALTTSSGKRVYNIPGSLNMPFHNNVVATQSSTLALATTWFYMAADELEASDSPDFSL